MSRQRVKGNPKKSLYRKGIFFPNGVEDDAGFRPGAVGFSGEGVEGVLLAARRQSEHDAQAVRKLDAWTNITRPA